MAASDRALFSRRIAQRFLISHHFLSSHTLGCYLATWDEVDCSTIIERAWRAKKRVFVPTLTTNKTMRFSELRPETTLTRNFFGLWEPCSEPYIDARDLDVVVTPLVAFDKKCHRIGMGGGYFDRTFAFLGARRYWIRPKLIGVAFECQRAEKIQPNPWDIPVYRVYTER